MKDNLEGVVLPVGSEDIDSGLNTTTDTDEPIVPETVGLVRATDDLTVLVTVAILLRKSAAGEEKSCYCKSSEKCFDSFHNIE